MTKYELELSLDEIKNIKSTLLKDFSEAEKDQFIFHCKRTGLHPLMRQIYAMKRWDSHQRKEVLSVQVSIDGFRVIAERSDKYAGQEDVKWYDDEGNEYALWLSDKPPAAAMAGVLRNDFKIPCRAVALFSSYGQKKKDGTLTPMWKQHGPLMIAKCAEALALRKAFPQELSGLYTTDEMSSAAVAEEPPKPTAQVVDITKPPDSKPPVFKKAQELPTSPEPNTTDWAAFGNAMISAVKACTKQSQIDEWLSVNFMGLAQMEKEWPKARKHLYDSIEKIRKALEAKGVTKDAG
jgi:phage recombination protein Bet